jgi:hypothetical protein
MNILNKIFTYWRDDLRIKNNSRTTLAGVEISKKKKHKSDHEFTTDVIPFNDAFKECGCLPDCGCKE